MGLPCPQCLEHANLQMPHELRSFIAHNDEIISASFSQLDAPINQEHLALLADFCQDEQVEQTPTLCENLSIPEQSRPSRNAQDQRAYSSIAALDRSISYQGPSGPDPTRLSAGDWGMAIFEGVAYAGVESLPSANRWLQSRNQTTSMIYQAKYSALFQANQDLLRPRQPLYPYRLHPHGGWSFHNYNPTYNSGFQTNNTAPIYSSHPQNVNFNIPTNFSGDYTRFNF